MPIFMDRHDVSEDVTAEIVAQLHREDLKIQHLYACKGLTYWFDDSRKTAFCLIEAPNKDAIVAMHANAHGEVPHSIIEVEESIVESFLGRIEDPEKAQNTELNIINDPAFRTIMALRLRTTSLKDAAKNTWTNVLDNFGTLASNVLQEFGASIVKKEADYFLISFSSVTSAVKAALAIKKRFNKIEVPDVVLDLGLSAGVPVTEKKGFFEDTIRMAHALCHVANAQIVISEEVKDLYESENLNVQVPTDSIRTIHYMEGKFMMALFACTEKIWDRSDIGVADFCRALGDSKSQFYRKLTKITGQSPNHFLRDFRLRKALVLLQKHRESISGIAYKTGFNSAAYFSKCFLDTYGVLPSKFIQLQLKPF